MATFNQIYTMVNDATAQMYGSEAITVKDTSSLVSLGEKVLSSETTEKAVISLLTLPLVSLLPYVSDCLSTLLRISFLMREVIILLKVS